MIAFMVSFLSSCFQVYSRKKKTALAGGYGRCWLLLSSLFGRSSGLGSAGLVVFHHLVGQQDCALVLSRGILEVAVVCADTGDVDSLYIGGSSISGHVLRD